MSKYLDKVKTNLMLESIKDQLIFTKYDNTKNTNLLPGTIIKLSNGSLQLVGDVNQLLGVCDDCTSFRQEDIIEVSHISEMLREETH